MRVAKIPYSKTTTQDFGAKITAAPIATHRGTIS